jgi:hypothetical protein
MRGFGFAPSARMDIHRYFDLLAESAKNRHQPIDREAAEMGAADAGKVGGSDPGQRMRVANGQVRIVKHADDAGGEDRAQLLAVGVGMAEVAENIAAAAHDFQIVGVIGHFSISLTRRRRAVIRSSSCFGVLIPVFDFFWKAWLRANWKLIEEGRPLNNIEPLE